MGVDLGEIVSKRKLKLEELRGCTIAVDAYNALYQFLAVIRGEQGEPLRDRSGRVTSHLSGLFYRNVNLLSLGIKPIYILDGQPPSLKAAEIARRRKVKEEAVVKYAEALSRGDYEAARKYAQFTSIIKDYMVEDTKTLLNLLGIPWIEAPSEGEATAAYLTKIGVATHTASQDYDSLLFGAPRLVRNVAISGRRKLPNKPVYVEVEPEEISLQTVLRELGLTREQLIDVGILVGTDFNPDGFKGIGPVKALKYIKQYGRLEDVPEIKDALAEIDYESIRSIFLNPKVSTQVEVKWGEVDEEGVVDFLCGERSFSEERVRSALSKLKDAQKKSSETLERWFGV
ncbi:MAG: flap endonuclease-1 [Nitrososphaerales archaeon]